MGRIVGSDAGPGLRPASVTLTRRADVHWFGAEVGRYFPKEWSQFREGVPEGERDGDLVAAYNQLLNTNTDPQIRLRAARSWVAWEVALLSLEAGQVSPNPGWADEPYMIAFARLVTHYFSHAAWLEEGELLANASRLAGIPGVILHGRLDLAGPADAAWLLAQAWPGAELHFVAGGHTAAAAPASDQRRVFLAAASPPPPSNPPFHRLHPPNRRVKTPRSVEPNPLGV